MSSRNRRPSRRDALAVNRYYHLYVGALQIDNYDRRLKACFVILMAGRLGLRVGEIQHLREAWIDWKRGEIVIPEYDPCACYECWIRAYDVWGRRGLAELQNNDEWEASANWNELLADERKEVVAMADYCTPENLYDILTTEQFSPKSDRGARVVPFGWSYRITACLMSFFDEFDCLDMRRDNVNGLIKEAASNAKGVSAENLSAHPLRATGLTFLADVANDSKLLQDVPGWQDPETARNYFRNSGRLNTAKMYRFMGRGDEAPPVVPEEPEDDFPVVRIPFPFQNEPFLPVTPDGIAADQEMREERHREQRSEPLQLHHPRETNLPHGRAGFPDADELGYDPSDHELPGHVEREEVEDCDFIELREGKTVLLADTLADYNNLSKGDLQGEPLSRNRDVEPYKHRADWVNSRLSEYSDSADTSSASNRDDPDLSMIDLWSTVLVSTTRGTDWLKSRLHREWDEYWTAGDRSFVGTDRAAKVVAVYFLAVVLPLAFHLALLFG